MTRAEQIIEALDELNVSYREEGGDLVLDDAGRALFLLREIQTHKSEILATLFIRAEGIAATEFEVRRLAQEYYAAEPVRRLRRLAA